MTYSVLRANRHELLYSEDGRELTVEVESGFDRPIDGPIGPEHLPFVRLAVYLSVVRRWNDGAAVTAEERERIGRHISTALTQSGTKHVIE